MQLINDDCLKALAELPENSVDLILTDPPYYRVKSDDWDNQWKTESEFMDWVEQVLAAFARVLKPNGSLYWFASPYMASPIEMVTKQYFNVLNHLVWVKKEGRHKGCNAQSLRKYFPQTERIIFAEASGADLASIKAANEERKALLKPVIDQLNNARKAAGMTIKDCEKLLGTTTVGHYFSASQFHFPREEHYLTLMQAFNSSDDYVSTRDRYEALQSEYVTLKAKYDQLRRPFTTAKDEPYTDVWQFDTVQHYKGKHPCEKPLPLLKHMIKTSSKPGDVVLDAFLGSGNTGVACKQMGRGFIGIERDPELFDKAKKRIEGL